MHSRHTHCRAALAATALLVMSPAARAAVVTYSTDLLLNTRFGNAMEIGSSAGFATVAADGSSSLLQINGVSGFSATVPPPSVVRLATLTVSSNSATPITNESPSFASYQLRVRQSTPSAASGVLSFTYGGDISTTSSTAYVQFSTPSVVVGDYLYTIIDADTGVPGRISVPAPSAGGSAYVLASVSFIPEPAGVSLAGAAGTLLLRRRRA